MRRRLLFALVLVVMSGGAALVAAELLLRVIRPAMAYPYMPQAITMSHLRPGTLLPFELKPNNRSPFRMLEFDTMVVTNSRGFRDAEVDVSRPRVLCMGDSYAFGFGVQADESYCGRLDRMFQGKYDVVNVGYADGYAPDTYALWLSKHVDELDPKALLVEFFQNDITDVNDDVWLRDGRPMGDTDQGVPDRIVRPGYVVTPDGGWGRDNMVMHWPPIARGIVKRSWLVGFLRDRLVHDIDGPPQTAAAPTVPSNETEDPAHRKFTRALEMLHAAAKGRPLVFYLIDARDQRVPSRMDGLIRRFAEQHAIPLLFNGEDFSREDTFTYETHWNASGHAKAARYLYDSLVKLGW